MARTAVSVKTSNRTVGAVTVTYAAADGTNNHRVPNAFSNVLLLFHNTTGSPINVIIYRPGLVDGVALSSKTIAVPANGDAVFGPCPARYYNNADHEIEFDVPATPTGLTVAAVLPGSLND